MRQIGQFGVASAKGEHGQQIVDRAPRVAPHIVLKAAHKSLLAQFVGKLVGRQRPAQGGDVDQAAGDDAAGRQAPLARLQGQRIDDGIQLLAARGQ